jgi:Mg2+ and Co2+ transporter CorA
MRSSLEGFINRSGQKYQIERNNVTIAEIDGLPNHEQATGKAYIGFMPGSDVKSGDWVINPYNEHFYITDTITTTVQKSPHSLKAYYLTVAEYQRSLQANNAATFNIQNAYGSVIGTQAHVVMNYNDSINQVKDQVNSSDSPDKEELQQIISLLEMVVNNQVPVGKGLFSKFTDVMERNSWITGSVASALISWLTTQIH